MGKFEYTFDDPFINACRINGNYCFSMYYNRTYDYEIGHDRFSRVNSKGDLFCFYEPGGRYDWLCETLGTGRVDSPEHHNEWLIDR